ncbi:hypothetical protein [Teredinibacter waterburyi]|jgi:hypothetical protein|uniref:hypothetical protein n=1 Tax=Teredinibacter waterburyi TaxID=1500538 RepID=UPI00165F8BAA|nr:hypothetical protein [Teredinibacter waterburyi]
MSLHKVKNALAIFGVFVLFVMARNIEIYYQGQGSNTRSSSIVLIEPMLGSMAQTEQEWEK